MHITSKSGSSLQNLSAREKQNPSHPISFVFRDFEESGFLNFDTIHLEKEAYFVSIVEKKKVVLMSLIDYIKTPMHVIIKDVQGGWPLKCLIYCISNVNNF